ncbi:M20 metallopeptidase family protein [Leucobacter triazinivorans]|uniref:Amidohydrolase n=1 Tax=Leucobacter triazinivorans TaxID=1784719 RepID=A0A4P6KIX3_9MICO|nr:amidohydrolase [Leucobacter triazinivorans]QBE50342.1 amidohydrolase [Leucobacter triazinivorans]
MMTDPWDRFFAAVAEEIPEALQLRRQLHRAPCISGEEGPTRDLVLQALGSPEWDPVADTGGLVRIGPSDGPAIALRAELDALPILEETGAAFASTNGAMHACGHDVHIAAAVAVARAAQRVALPVALLLILQPREEAYPSGARDICESGLLEQHGVREVFGAHVHPRVPAGGIAIGEGAVNAAADEFGIAVRGIGGHAAYPHHARDPIVALAAVIGAMQMILNRRIDPMHPAVLSFGTIHAGSAANVIPSEARARGSMRTMHPRDRAFLHTEIPRVASEVAAAHGCSAEVEIISGEPVLYNHPEMSRSLMRALEGRAVRVVEPMRSCGADDFSYYTERLPGVMMFVGVARSEHEPALHTSAFLPGDEAVSDIAMAYAISVRTAFGIGVGAGSGAEAA